MVKHIFAGLIFCLAFLTGCGASPDAQATMIATAITASAAAWTPTPRPTETQPPLPTRTSTPAPTATAKPTSTPQPTPAGNLTKNLVVFQEKPGGDIQVADLKGENKINLTQELKGIKRLWGWSPDGSWILVSRYDQEPPARIDDLTKYVRELWVFSPDGKTSRLLMNIGTTDIPYWSWDSSALIVTSPKSADTRGVFIANLKELKVIDTNFIGRDPAISADGKNFAWFYNGEIRYAQGNRRPIILARYDSGFVRSLLFSADGQYLLYMVDNLTDKVSTLHRVKLEGTDQPEALRTFERQVWPVSISPDHNWIVIIDYTNQSAGWGVVTLDGKTFNWVKDYLLPEWMPDSKQLIAQKGKTIFLLDPQTLKEKDSDILKWVSGLTGSWYLQPAVK